MINFIEFLGFFMHNEAVYMYTVNISMGSLVIVIKYNSGMIHALRLINGKHFVEVLCRSSIKIYVSGMRL